MLPIVYVTENFLVSYQEKIKVPFVMLEPKEIDILNFISKLLHSSHLSINLSQEEIIEIVKPVDNLAIQSTKLHIVKRLSISNSYKITSCKNYIENGKNTNEDNFLDSLHPDYILHSCNETAKVTIFKSFGIITIDDTFYSKLKIFSHFQKHIKVSTEFKITEFYNQFFISGNSLVVVDPFIFHNDSDVEYLISLLKSLLVMNRNILHISIIYPSAKDEKDKKDKKNKEIYKDRKKIINKISNQIISKETKIIFIPSTKKLHDRHIFSNTVWIKSGKGFKKYYDVDTSLDFYPIGTYFDSYSNEITNISDSIPDNYFQNIQNPIIRRFNKPSQKPKYISPQFKPK